VTDQPYQFLEAGDVAAVIIGASQRGWKGPVNGIALHQVLELTERPLPVLGVGEAFGLVQFGSAREFAGVQAYMGPLAKELLAQCCYVDGGRRGGRQA